MKEIDKQQAEILIEKYKQLLEEYNQLLEKNKEDELDKINKRYIGLLDRKLPRIELKLEHDYGTDFLLSLDYFIQWLDETLKNYKLYPEEQEHSTEEIITDSKKFKPNSNGKNPLTRIKKFFIER